MATTRIVWAKLKHGIGWWPGQVTEDFPSDVTESLKKKPLAVVKFFNADEYEPITSAKDMIEYREEKRLELIKKGLTRLKNQSKEEANFIQDVKEAEKITGGDPSEVDNIKKELLTPQTPKKPSYSDIFKPPPKELPTPAPTSGIKFNFRKPSKSQSPQKREQQSTPTSQQLGPPKKYSCDICGLTSDRVGVVTAHRRSHSSADYSHVNVSTPARGNLSSPGSSVTGSTGSSSSPAKARVESPKSPSKEKIPAKKRGRKKKEQAKEDILNDWSDEEYEANAEKQREEADESNAPLMKKPRTDKELSDAFEALLQSTQPTEEATDIKVKVEETICQNDALIKNKLLSKDVELKQELTENEESKTHQKSNSNDHNNALTLTNTNAATDALSTMDSEVSAPVPIQKCPSPVNVPKEALSPANSNVEIPEDMADAFDAIMQSTQPPKINKTSKTKIDEKVSPSAVLTISNDKPTPKDLDAKIVTPKKIDKSEKKGEKSGKRVDKVDESPKLDKDSGPSSTKSAEEAKDLVPVPVDKCPSPTNLPNEPSVSVDSTPLETEKNLSEAFDAIMQSTRPPILKGKGRGKGGRKSAVVNSVEEPAPAPVPAPIPAPVTAPKNLETKSNTQNKNKGAEKSNESQKDNSVSQEAAQTPTKTPAKTAVKTPVKPPVKTPVKTPAKPPAKTPTKAPVKTPAKPAVKASAPETTEIVATTQTNKVVTAPVTLPKDLPMAVKSTPVAIQQPPAPAAIQVASATKPEIGNANSTVSKTVSPKELPVAIKSAPVLSEPTKVGTPQGAPFSVANSQVVNSATALPKELPIAVKSTPVLIESPKKPEISKKSAPKTPVAVAPPAKKEKKSPPTPTAAPTEKAKGGKKPVQTYRGKKVGETAPIAGPTSTPQKGPTATDTVISNKAAEKPTAAIKPSVANEAMKRNEDDSIIRQALQGTLKSSPAEMQSMTNAKPNEMGAETETATSEEVNRVADQVVHLVPVENPDGTVTYMLLSLGSQAELCIDATEGAAPTIGEDAIFVDKATDGDTFFASITQPNPPTNSAAQSTISQRAASAPAHSTATAQVLLQNQLQGMQILQSNQQTNEVILSHRHQMEGGSLIEVSGGNTDSSQTITAGSAMLDLSSLGLTSTGATAGGVPQLQGGSEQHQIVFLAEDGSIINAENVNWADYTGAFIN